MKSISLKCLKRILLPVLCVAMLSVVAMTASAQVDFGGRTSGGTSGTTQIKGEIDKTTSGAYTAFVGFNPNNINASFTLDVTGHLYVLSSPMGGHKIIDRVFSYTSHPGMDICKGGAENTCPPNRQNGYQYTKVVVDAYFQSPLYGSWAGSGTMNY